MERLYRDGGWTPDPGSWWSDPHLAMLTLDLDGRITSANNAARSLLGIGDPTLDPRHYSDFVAPGSLADTQALVQVLQRGHDLTATILIRPSSGEVIACEAHATRGRGDLVVVVLRMAEEIAIHTGFTNCSTVLITNHDDDGFRRYADVVLDGMSEPTVDGLALRLRRLYPHASVVVDGDVWRVRRDITRRPDPGERWWRHHLGRWFSTTMTPAPVQANVARKVLRAARSSVITGRSS